MIWAIGDSAPGALGVAVPGVVEAATPPGVLEPTTAPTWALNVGDAARAAGRVVAAGGAQPDLVEINAAAPDRAAPDRAAGGCPGVDTVPELVGPAVSPPAPLEFAAVVEFAVVVAAAAPFRGEP